MAEVELQQVTKTWGSEAAVDAVSFNVQAGQLAALLGPSGCGKSTTLRLVAGLETATAGAIRISGKDVTTLPPAQRDIAMVFQSYALFPHLSVAENIMFGLRVRNVEAAERNRRLAAAADLLGLGKLLDRRPSQLSGGQQQRVALGRAIVAEKPVCLMDEPLSNLDAQLRLEMRREIRALQQRLGMTMLYVTHDQLEAMTMADHVVLMRAGRIEQQGPPAVLYERPATTFVARFVGTPPMNVLPAAALASLEPDRRPALPAGRAVGDVDLGLRPEAVHLADSGLPAEVVAVEYLGADTLVETRVANVPFVVRLPGRAEARAGQTVAIGWNGAAVHWFDAKSGRRID